MLPHLSGDTAARLRGALHRAAYHTKEVRALLGAEAHAALGRGEPVPALRRSADGGSLGVLVRLFLLGTAEPADAVAAALSPLDPAQAVAHGLLRADGDRLAAAVDVRPYGDEHGEWWVVSDLEPLPGPPVADPGTEAPDRVLGVGEASVSLARATIREPVHALLDLGTGCGVQVLHAARHAARLTATDVTPRALAFAAATFALNDLDVELLRGPWFEPVAGRRFDQVISNPPFVVGPARVEHVYRDSGLPGDRASALLVRSLPDHLTEGGTGQLLAAWLVPSSGEWAERVSAWVAPSGVDAWIVQRDIADPALYVGTWLADSGGDPRSPRGRAAAQAWLDWFDRQDAIGVGFGFVTLRRTGADRSSVVCEDLRQVMDDPLGPEAAAMLRRIGWLRATDDDTLLDTRFTLGADVVLERTETPGPEGWRSESLVLRRRGGPGWRHPIDERGTALLAGCTGHLTLEELIRLLAAAHDEPADPMVATALPVARELVRHGILVAEEGSSCGPS